MLNVLLSSENVLFFSGNGTHAPTFDTQDTFFYLSQKLEWDLKVKMRNFEERFAGSQFLYPEHRIRNGQDHMAWKEQFAPRYILQRHQNGPRPRYIGEKPKPKHSFGGPRPMGIKYEIKREVKREFFKREK